MISRIEKATLYLIGGCLWIPSISIFSIDSRWGLQFSLLFSALLAVEGVARILLGYSIPTYKLSTLLRYQTALAIALVGFVWAIAINPNGIAEASGAAVSSVCNVFFLAVVGYYAFTFIPVGLKVLLAGFKSFGLLSCVYALYQFLALMLGLPFGLAYLNNPSFENLPDDAAQLHQRSFAFTPEPSVFASLCLTLIVLFFCDFLAHKTRANFAALMIAIAGLIVTRSQSILLLPFVVIYTLMVARRMANSKLHLTKIVFSASLFLAICVLVLLQDDVFLERILSIADPTAPSAARLRDVFLLGQALLDRPLGYGLGSYGRVASIYGGDHQIGASSGALRLLVEFGIGGAFIFFVSACVLRSARGFSTIPRSICIKSRAACFALLISYVFFVGYRNLYHLSLIPLFFVAGSGRFRDETRMRYPE